MPRKNCEGAKAIPDDLKSWCDSKYYNECECQYEKAVKQFDAEKERLNQKTKNLGKQRSDLDQKVGECINKATQLAYEITTSDYSGSFSADRQKAMDLIANAISDAQKAIDLTEQMQQVYYELNGKSNTKDAAKYRRIDFSNYKNKLEEIRNLKK